MKARREFLPKNAKNKATVRGLRLAWIFVAAFGIGIAEDDP
jgi:hypothetical protein